MSWEGDFPVSTSRFPVESLTDFPWKGKMKGLNLGCGTRIFHGTPEIQWYNHDGQPGKNIEYVSDIRSVGAMFPNETFDFIVAHHCFEHVGCGEQPIKQCHYLLVAGGSLIVAVPNLRWLAGMLLRGEIDMQLYVTNIYGPYDGSEYSRHRWGFDGESLAREMRAQAPWVQVKPFNWRDIPGTDIARDDRWILVTEGVK